jgi:hypothetical protein
MFITYSIKQDKTNNSKIQNNSTGLIIMTHTLNILLKPKAIPM